MLTPSHPLPPDQLKQHTFHKLMQCLNPNHKTTSAKTPLLNFSSSLMLVDLKNHDTRLNNIHQLNAQTNLATTVT